MTYTPSCRHSLSNPTTSKVLFMIIDNELRQELDSTCVPLACMCYRLRYLCVSLMKCFYFITSQFHIFLFYFAGKTKFKQWFQSGTSGIKNNITGFCEPFESNSKSKWQLFRIKERQEQYHKIEVALNSKYLIQIQLHIDFEPTMTLFKSMYMFWTAPSELNVKLLKS